MSIYNPFAVLDLMGLHPQRAVPVIGDCPLCGAAGKLEIRHTEHVSCKNPSCRFQGDIGELYARWIDQPLKRAVDSLVAAGVVAADEAPAYVAERRRQAEIRRLFDEAADGLRQSVDARAYAAISQQLYREIAYEDLLQLLPCVAWVSTDDLQPLALGKHARQALTRIGKGRHVVLPAYAGMDIIGCWALTGGQEIYLPFYDQQAGATFVPLTSVREMSVIACATAGESLRLTAWSAMTRTRPLGFVHPTGQHQPYDWASARNVYWSQENYLEWVLTACGSTESEALDYDIPHADGLPLAGNWQAFCQLFEQHTRPAPAVAARLLSQAPAAAARGAILASPTSASVRERILRELDADDRGRVDQLFEIRRPTDNVLVAGKSITQRGDCWYAGGKKITDLTFVIDTVVPVPGTDDAYVTGVVHHAGSSHPFRESYQLVVEKTARWLKRFLISQAGAICEIDNSWARHLLSISRAFHQPRPVMIGRDVGWQDQLLILPKFLIDSAGISPSAGLQPGPQIPLPHPLLTHEERLLSDPDTCRMILFHLYNLAATSRGLPCVGGYLVSERHALPHIADVLGQQSGIDLPEPEWQLTTRRPWLTVMRGLPAYATDGRRNVLVSVDAATAQCLDLHGGWVRLSARQLDYPDVLRLSWLALPRLLRDWSGDGQQLSAACLSACGAGRGAFSAAYDQLNAQLAACEVGAGARFIHWAAVNLQQPNAEGPVEISWQQVERQLAASTIRPPTARQVADGLRESRMLQSFDRRQLKIRVHRRDWDMYRSYVAAGC